jgi:hypothetical protein
MMSLTDFPLSFWGYALETAAFTLNRAPSIETTPYELWFGAKPKLSFLIENMMLCKLDMFVTLRNDGPSTDERDKHWSMTVHGDGSKRLRIEEDEKVEISEL